MRTLIILTALAVCLACAPAHTDDYQDCNQTQDSDLRSRACTKIVSNLNEKPENIGTAYARLCKLSADKNDLPRATLACENANVLYTQAENYLNLGSAEFENDLPAEALVHFESALIVDPYQVEALYNRKVALELLAHTKAVANATPKP